VGLSLRLVAVDGQSIPFEQLNDGLRLFEAFGLALSLESRGIDREPRRSSVLESCWLCRRPGA